MHPQLKTFWILIQGPEYRLQVLVGKYISVLNYGFVIYSHAMLLMHGFL